MTKRRACLLASWAFFYELSVKLPKERIDARLAVHKTDRGSTSSFEFA
ncbi:hypothetical protein [Megasphaera sp.]